VVGGAGFLLVLAGLGDADGLAALGDGLGLGLGLGEGRVLEGAPTGTNGATWESADVVPRPKAK
jgi:hypothetical protein